MTLSSIETPPLIIYKFAGDDRLTGAPHIEYVDLSCWGRSGQLPRALCNMGFPLKSCSSLYNPFDLLQARPVGIRVTMRSRVRREL